MNKTIATSSFPDYPATFAVNLIWLACLILAVNCAVFAKAEISTSDDEKTLIVNDAPEMEVIAFAKSVVVKKHAKGVFSFGGDVTIEGRVDGDVATIGGNIIQKDAAYVGGDIIVLGGAYKPESESPLREPGKETVIFGVLEDELRDLAQNPSHILSPSFSWSFLAQRIVVALLWFVVSIVMTTVAPGAVSRAVARIRLSSLKVCAIGAGAFLLVAIFLVGGALSLPNFLGVTLGAMGILLLLLGFVFGRVALQVSVGKLIQKHLFPENNHSETLATLAGVMFWTLLLSLPYLWIVALFTVFAFGIGLILTARPTTGWQKA